MENSSTSVRTGVISIGLNLPMPVKEKGDCQHFCLRQYVAETRKKDIQICSPFGSSSKSEEQLPPVDVPKFKCWRCCIREVGATTAAAYILSKMKYVSETWNDNNVVGNMTDKAGDGTGSEGVRIEEIGNPAIEVIVSKQCSAREIEPKGPVVQRLQLLSQFPQMMEMTK